MHRCMHFTDLHQDSNSNSDSESESLAEDCFGEPFPVVSNGHPGQSVHAMSSNSMDTSSLASLDEAATSRDFPFPRPMARPKRRRYFSTSDVDVPNEAPRYSAKLYRRRYCSESEDDSMEATEESCTHTAGYHGMSSYYSGCIQ